MSNPNPIGRPTKYDPAFCDQLVEHMRDGLSFESFGGVIGVAKDTLYNWVKQHVEFSDAKKIGTEASRLFWEQLGIRHIINKSDSEFQGGSSSRSLNASIWIFNMKNRFGWRDRIEHSVDEQKPIILKYSLDEEVKGES